ncbi:GNAT family N-acetyltransferase [Paenibacillus sacheonensis]|uniref:GNAT family N-acetyltransferase n=1 Tax=Paenibacillus sacheonensis TaxID=742054 RepID=A0A7X5BYB3_9BACL|nr:GNAT family N-acetyltransferase [Paenibacillus sacheonensis]MBM7564730.1 GNAT superfamily N-acetyltransferase [Paenibacillus sacheonensis]NBC69286.1 GNAT family N-acetyltransferase [Paenibacillus sacheonensis]
MTNAQRKPEPARSQEESAYVRNQLIAYNASRLPESIRDRYEEIHLIQRDAEGTIVGGLLSEYCWQWIEVHILWVDENCRREGHGTALLEEIERIAREKQCSFIKLNTFSFQAPDFYKKHGYAELAVIDNAPLEHRHYYFIKRIS